MSMLMLWLLFVVLPGLQNLSCFLLFISCIGLIAAASAIVSLGWKQVKPWALSALFVVLFSGLLANIIPSERQIALLAGGYAVTNVEGIGKLPENVVKAANLYLENLNKSLESAQEK